MTTHEYEKRVLALIEQLPGIRTTEIRHALNAPPGLASTICTQLRRSGAILLTRKGGWTRAGDSPRTGLRLG
jgi:hypothetical protein